MNAQTKLFEDHFKNAMDVWHDDLVGEAFDFPYS